MTDYKYAEPKDAAEASARIQHWMGDLSEFQGKLGLHDPGNGREPYYPRYSGSALMGLDVLIAMDQRRYPEKWIEPVAPVPSLHHSWLATLTYTRDEGKRFVDTWTDLEFVKTRLRGFVKDAVARAQRRVLGWLGEKPLPSKLIPKTIQSWPTSRVPGGPPYDPETYAKVQKVDSRGDDEDLFT